VVRTFNTIYTNIKELEQFCVSHNITDQDTLLLQIFTGVLDQKYLEELIDSITALLPNVQIIGTTTAGEILNSTIQSCSTILSFSKFEKTKISVYSVEQKQTSYDTGEELVNSIENIEDAKAVIIFAEGLQTNGELFIKAFHDNAPDTLIAGALAGDNATFTDTFVFTQNGVQNNGAVCAALFGEELIVNTAYSFGWEKIGQELTITHAHSNTVHTINGVSAVSIYNKYLGSGIGKQLPKTGIEFPLIVERDDYKIARAVMDKNDDGSLIFSGDLKSGEKAYLGYGNVTTILHERHKLYNELIQTPIESLFIYSSMSRKKLLQEEKVMENALIAQNAPQCGFFSYGEFYHCNKEKDYCHNHLFNQTMTLLTLSESTQISADFTTQKPHEENTKTIRSIQALTHLINTTTNELNQSKNKMKEYIKLVDQNIITSSTDLYGYITDVSEAFCEISGYTKEELIGKNHNIIRHPDMPKSAFKEMWRVIKKDQVWSGEVKNKKADGSSYWVNATIYPSYDQDGNKIGYTAIRQDITSQKIIEEISITDGLTEVFNRRHFNDIFPKMINGAKRRDEYFAFVIIDIDHFKQFNDIYGHKMGDDILKDVAACIKNTLKRADDYCFRLGGEEFAVIFDINDYEHSISFANTIRKNIENLKIIHSGNSAGEYITISAGLVCKKASQIQDEDELYTQADDLLYKAKSNGRNRVEVNL
jgi:diguanylate cyclase (GGDEF)-like protein/PAS domain S-box-containing protein